MCDSNIPVNVVDLKTPINEHLSAFYKRSFAYQTVKNRLPVIITQTIDELCRIKNKIGTKYGSEALEELKTITGQLSTFVYELLTNKPLRPLIGDAPDIEFYNNYLNEQGGDNKAPTYFSTIWLLAECYCYERILEPFRASTYLKDYDPFFSKKENAFNIAIPLMQQLSAYYLDMLEKTNLIANETELIDLLRINLWSNRADLSITLGKDNNANNDLMNISLLNDNILCDHSDKIWKALEDQSYSLIVDIVMDNAGYEAFCDFCLADYLITKNLCKIVRFHIKLIPWFISDVTSNDFNWMIEELIKSENISLKAVGERWKYYLTNEKWTIIINDFWIKPIDYSQMSKIEPEYYNLLAEAKLIIFKGDLNYRKLFGEKNWPPSTPVDQGLQGFHPTKLCTLRTIKSDIICGISTEKYEELEIADPKWMQTGDYAVIQFSNKIVKI